MSSPVPELTPELLATVLQGLADAFMDQYPGIIAIPLKPGEKPPPGVRVLPAALPREQQS